ncbi:hypothetical protein VTL71DRAFT_13177 [Oculimacula yallundae]|uniref:Uncharacterized protein n=1 Tax=Oculimacula yallundae TaxID=86028 RepID=A0ABR4CJL3_9HELO
MKLSTIMLTLPLLSYNLLFIHAIPSSMAGGANNIVFLDRRGRFGSIQDLSLTFVDRRLVGRLDSRDLNDVCTLCDTKRCRDRTLYLDEDKCQCMTCPKGMIANRGGFKCIVSSNIECPEGQSSLDGVNCRGNGQQNAKQKKNDLWQRTVEKYKTKYDLGKKDFKKKMKEDLFNKRLQQYKDLYKKKIEDLKKQQDENDRNDKKRKRIGKCLLITPLAMASKSFTYVTDYFDEDFIAGDDMLALWPDNFDLDESVDIDTEAFQKEWIARVDAIEDANNEIWSCLNPGCKAKREDLGDENVDLFDRYETRKRTAAEKRAVVTSNSTDLIEYIYETSMSPHLEARFVQFILEAIFVFLRGVGVVVEALGPTAARLASVVARGIRVAKNGVSKIARSEMKSSSQKIAKDRSWKRCLKGEMPTRY